MVRRNDSPKQREEGSRHAIMIPLPYVEARRPRR
jgi:hypothetical protein